MHKPPGTSMKWHNKSLDSCEAIISSFRWIFVSSSSLPCLVWEIYCRAWTQCTALHLQECLNKSRKMSAKQIITFCLLWISKQPRLNPSNASTDELSRIQSAKESLCAFLLLCWRNLACPFNRKFKLWCHSAWTCVYYWSAHFHEVQAQITEQL